jgi:hypothetical protein
LFCGVLSLKLGLVSHCARVVIVEGPTSGRDGIRFDLEYGACVRFSDEYVGIFNGIRCEQFKAVASTFAASLASVKALATLPAALIYWSMLLASFRAEARTRLGKQIMEGEDSRDVVELAEVLLHEFNARRDIRDPSGRDLWSLGAHNLTEMIRGEQSATRTSR